MQEINKEQIIEAIIQYLLEDILAPDVDFTTDTRLAELGIDSVSIIELVLFIDRQFAVRLPDSLLTPENLLSIQSLAACVMGQIGDITAPSAG